MGKAKTTKARRTESVRGATYRYTVQFEPAEEGGYIAKVPALNGIATQGETLEEARAMAEDLIRGYLQSLRKHGEPIPVERDEALTTHIAVSLADVLADAVDLHQTPSCALPSVAPGSRAI